GDLLIFAEGAALAQQDVDQRRFAMIDMRDDGDVSQLHRLGALKVCSRARTRPARHGPRPGRARSGGDTIAPRIRQTRTVASQIWPRRQTIKAQSAGAAARGVAPGGPTVDDLPMTRPRRHAAGLTGAGRALLKLGL